MCLKTIRLLPFLLLLSACKGSTSTWEMKQITTFTVITIIIAGFVLLARNSNMLRDEVNDCEAFEANVQKLQRQQRTKISSANPYSQNKVQFGLWTVIIACSYIYLSLFRGDCGEGAINKTALVLMGIFAGTTAASTVIDKKEISDNRPRHQNTPSQGFFTDVLSDDNGISLHRFQNFVWTIIAITVYLYKLSQVEYGCRLPELSDTLLALTGISSATYLVLRTQENDPSIQSAVQQSPTGAAIAPTGNSTASVPAISQ